MDEESSAAIIAHKLLKRFSEACIYGNQGGYSFMAKEVCQIIRDAKSSERERCANMERDALDELESLYNRLECTLVADAYRVANELHCIKQTLKSTLLAHHRTPKSREELWEELAKSEE